MSDLRFFLPGGTGLLKVSLSEVQGRKDFAHWLGEAVDQALAGKELLHRRWRVLEAMYRNEPGSSGFRLMKRVEIHPAPLITPRIKRISNTVYAQVLAPDPWVQCIPDEWGSTREGAVEKGLQAIAERSGFRETFRDSLDIAGCCGQAIIRRRFVAGEGLEDELIHPADFIVSPTYQTDLREAHLMGHRFYLPVWRIEELRRTGKFISGPSLAASSTIEPSGHSQTLSGGVENQNSEEDSRRPVELWELLAIVQFESGPQRVRAVISVESRQLLLAEIYPYEEPWYFDLRYHKEYGVWWNSNSVANLLQGLQHDYTILHALLTQGTLVSALPPLVVSGGFLTERLKSYDFADVIETDVPIQAQSLPISFRPETIPVLIDQIERLADAVTGVSQLGISQELRQGTTATEVNVLAAIQKQSENSYLSYASQTLSRLWQFALVLAKHHRASFLSTYGPALPPDFWTAIRKIASYRFLVSGESGSEIPAVQMQSLQTLLAMSQAPNSGLDYRAVELAVVNAMPVKFATQTLFRHEEPTRISTEPGRGEGPRLALHARGEDLSRMVPPEGTGGDSEPSPKPTQP
jgi:hypothetical protein